MSETALATFGRHGAGLRVGHEAAGAEHLAETTDLAHELGGRDRRVERGVAAGDLLDELGAADLVSAGCDGGLGGGAGREHDDAGGLAGAVREDDGAAHHLVGLAGVDAELQRDLDGRVELRRTGLLRERDCLGRGVELAVFDLLGRGAVGL